MNNYYFELDGELIEIKSRSCRTAVISFILEFYNSKEEKCQFKFLGKDFYNQEMETIDSKMILPKINFDDIY